MNIAESCFRKSTVTLSLAAALLVAGVLSYFKLGRLEDPEFTIRSAQVVALWPGATAEDVAAAVAFLLAAKATTGCVIPVDGGQHLLLKDS